jgi:hypothetical protein
MPFLEPLTFSIEIKKLIRDGYIRLLNGEHNKMREAIRTRVVTPDPLPTFLGPAEFTIEIDRAEITLVLRKRLLGVIGLLSSGPRKARLRRFWNTTGGLSVLEQS